MPSLRRLVRLRARSLGATVTAAALVGALVAVPGTTAAAAPADYSEAQGQVLVSPLLQALQLAELGYTHSAYPSSKEEAAGTLPVGLVDQLIGLRLPNLPIPLISSAEQMGLLHLGELGLLGSYSHAPTATGSRAVAGAVDQDGAIAISPESTPEEAIDPAYIDLTSLFGQLGITALTDEIIDQARIELGAIASAAEANGGALSSDYVLTGLDLKVHSPLVGGILTGLGTTVQGTLGGVSGLLAKDGALGKLLTGVENTVNALTLGDLAALLEVTSAQVSIDGLDTVGTTVKNRLLTRTLANKTGSVTVNLGTGYIHVDLAKIMNEVTGGTRGLNGLPANTSVLSAPVINALLAGVTDSLTTGLTTAVGEVLLSVLTDLQVTLDLGVEAACLLTACLARGGILVQASLGDFAGLTGKKPTVTTTLKLVGLDIGLLLNPVLDFLTRTIASTTGPLIRGVLNSIVTIPSDGGAPTGGLVQALVGIVSGVVDVLDPVLTGVLEKAVVLRVNEQPTLLPGGEADIPGDDAFTVRALGVTVLPVVDAADGILHLGLASSSVRALADEPLDADATADASADAQGTVDGDATSAVDADGTTDADGAADPAATADADAAAASAANADASSDASGDISSDANASATAAAASTADADSTSAADATAAANGNASAAAAVAANADSSSDATADAAAEADASTAADAAGTADTTGTTTADANGSTDTTGTADANGSTDTTGTADTTGTTTAAAAGTADADGNLNASASAAASATADAEGNAAAIGAAEAAAMANADSDATAAATADATAAAAAAANADASSNASGDTSSDANASATAAVAANATSSNDASADAAADGSASTLGASTAGTSADADGSTGSGATAATAVDATAAGPATTAAAGTATAGTASDSRAGAADAASAGPEDDLAVTGAPLSLLPLGIAILLVLLGAALLAARARAERERGPVT